MYRYIVFSSADICIVHYYYIYNVTTLQHHNYGCNEIYHASYAYSPIVVTRSIKVCEFMIVWRTKGVNLPFTTNILFCKLLRNTYENQITKIESPALTESAKTTMKKETEMRQETDSTKMWRSWVPML